MVKPMPVSYSHIAGVSLERLAALSDGIFAVAMTLLVLGFSVRPNNALHPARPLWAPGALTSEHVVWDVLRRLAPHLLTYLMSFLTLGIFWVGQQTQLGQFRRSDRDLTWIHLAFLLGVSLMPFSTMLLADYITYRMAVAVYWLNIALLGALLYAGARYARRAKLIEQDVTTEMTAASERRIIAYQALYAFGALLSVFSPYLSIGFIVAVQLNAAITPRIWRLDRFCTGQARRSTQPPRHATAGSRRGRRAHIIRICTAVNSPELNRTAVHIEADIARFAAAGTVTVCDETSASGKHTGCPQTQVSVKQMRHGEHDSVTVTIVEGFRSASYDLSIFSRSDVRHSWRVTRNSLPRPGLVSRLCTCDRAGAGSADHLPAPPRNASTRLRPGRLPGVRSSRRLPYLI
jgi:TMEM175 potassium channel family protein